MILMYECYLIYGPTRIIAYFSAELLYQPMLSYFQLNTEQISMTFFIKVHNLLSTKMSLDLSSVELWSFWSRCNELSTP